MCVLLCGIFTAILFCCFFGVGRESTDSWAIKEAFDKSPPPHPPTILEPAVDETTMTSTTPSSPITCKLRSGSSSVVGTRAAAASTSAGGSERSVQSSSQVFGLRFIFSTHRNKFLYIFNVRFCHHPPHFLHHHHHHYPSPSSIHQTLCVVRVL